jgi:hypothetical protein
VALTVNERRDIEDIIKLGPAAVARFEEMVKGGQSVRMAAMLVMRSPPRTGITDRTLQANSPKVSQQFRNEPWMLKRYRDGYRRATGENLPDDAVVYRSLARFPGDPGAIVTHKHSLADVRRTMKERNCWVEGDWENHPVSQRPDDPEPLGGITMERYVSEYREQDEYRNIPLRDLQEHIQHEHGCKLTGEDLLNAPTTVEEISRRCGL